jgi:ECF sigma factor
VDARRATLTSRTHFYGVAASLMRQILVEDARRRWADKRGGGVTMLHLDEVSPVAPTSSVDVLALDRRSTYCRPSIHDRVVSWRSGSSPA